MKLKQKIRSISGWLLASYGAIIIISFLGSIICIFTIRSFINLDRTLVKVETPAIEKLSRLKSFTEDLKKLSSIYVYQNNLDDKYTMTELANKEYPALLTELESASKAWDIENQKETYLKFNQLAHSYLEDVHLLMQTLNTLEDYNNDEKVDVAIWILDKKIMGKSYDISILLSQIIKDKQAFTDDVQSKKERAFLILVVVLMVSLAVIVGISFAIMRFSKSLILNLIGNVNQIVVKLGEGEIPENPQTSDLNEINLLNEAINSLVLGTKNKIEFAQNIGKGKYDAPFEILGENDILGKALQKMSGSLKENENIILDKNRKITDSINYSQRIQNSLLPTEKRMMASFPELFMIFKPRDIVSGDFPYFYEEGNHQYIAIVDCTGHGVPGALMSFVGYFILDQIMSENDHTRSASDLLELFNMRIQKALRQDARSDSMDDGMDMALCKLNKQTLELEFAGARRPLYVVSEGHFKEIKGDKFPIGGISFDMRAPFVNHRFQMAEGDRVFMNSDGLPDQFGGKDGNQKFLSKRVRAIIESNKSISMDEMKAVFENEFYKWMGPTKQIDDILILGFCINPPAFDSQTSSQLMA